MSRVDKWHQKQQSKYIFNKIYTTTDTISLPVLAIYARKTITKTFQGIIQYNN